MNGIRFGPLLCMVVFSFLAATAGAAEYSGLWVGTATINAVSEVNKRGSDLSFDLGLTGVKGEDTLISKGETWQYNNDSVEPGTGWQEGSENWSGNDKAPLGYRDPGGESDDGVVIETVINDENKYPTTYFRKSFEVQDDSCYGGLRLRVWRDDGIVLYINGEEILRNNLKTSFVDFNSLALSEITDNNYLEVTLPATLLKTGTNWLAAEVHLASENDHDLIFDLELLALLKESSTTEFISIESDDWRYNDKETELSPDWREPRYSDSDWLSGQAQFGYGESDEATELTYSSSQKPATTYFRKIFSADHSDYTHLRLMLLQDDGAVVYVNGKEIFRVNMPSGEIKYESAPVKAIGSSDENRYLVREIAISEIKNLGLQQTGNVVAVEVHQHPSEFGNTTVTTAALTSTPATLDLRLMLHVDSEGMVRLLKEVIQMYDSKNQRFVLLTDHTLVPDYTGVASRDGKPVGRRLSAAGFDFAGPFVQCSGGVSTNGIVTCAITLASNHPTNPFLHRYHPDHDNLDDRYEEVVEDAYEIKRNITITFDSRYPPDSDKPIRTAPPGWGYSMLGGTYTETLTGLHKDDISVSGPFFLQRVANTAKLNE